LLLFGFSELSHPFAAEEGRHPICASSETVEDEKLSNVASWMLDLGDEHAASLIEATTLSITDGGITSIQL